MSFWFPCVVVIFCLTIRTHLIALSMFQVLSQVTYISYAPNLVKLTTWCGRSHKRHMWEICIKCKMEYRQPPRLWPAWFFHAGCKL